ncbi:uncharacterized protein A4U43_UnF8230 [Asparagus officinalis]|uniref:Uncharacterized protein n=1 Tax=Asparagus officinalis TaxID=4686 RepID=A0A1R3L603_ASPOF|nr:uncharacterized protein A4U43_UnF8230 [Asparagus officinalis]
MATPGPRLRHSIVYVLFCINTIIRELRGLAVTRAFPPKEDFKTKALVSAIANFASGPSPDFLSVLKEVAVEVHNVYVLRSGQNPALDPLRDVILGLFRSKGANAKLTRQEIVKATNATLKRDIPDSEYKQVVNELCVYVKGTWALRGADNTE